MQRAQGFSQQGGQVVYTAGVASSTLVQESAPFALITVYLTGTTIRAVLYSDNLSEPTPLANPFTANSDGYWFFYASNGRYDVMIEAQDFSWTISDLPLFDLISVPGVNQTPWLSNIDAAGFNLVNVSGIGIGGPSLVNAALNIVTQTSPAIYMNSPVPAAANQIWFANDLSTVLLMGLGGSLNASAPNAAFFNTSAPSYLFALTNREFLRITSAGMGWNNPAPAYSIDVAGDVNVTGAYRVNGIPISGQDQTPWLSNIDAAGNSLNNVGRIGVGNPAPAYPIDVVGDVNVTGTYRVNGVPISTGGGQNQTPWLSNIFAAGYNLDNVGGLGVGGPSQVTVGLINVTVSTNIAGLNVNSSLATGAAACRFQNDALGLVIMGLQGSANTLAPGTFNFNTNATGGYTFALFNSERVRITNTGVGVFQTVPAYPIDVVGDVNITGTYRVNGVPISGGGGGGSQTPWLSNIDAAGFTLSTTDASGNVSSLLLSTSETLLQLSQVPGTPTDILIQVAVQGGYTSGIDVRGDGNLIFTSNGVDVLTLFNSLDNRGITMLNLGVLPSSPGGLSVGSVWVDAAAGSVLKIVF